ncbi:hypothetical protein, partial [Pseudescherichia sp. L3]|uniref:hypothetical protein n=1 Tax=Pseudescherichia sp. L3 TaxID=2970817 RepID=UPI00214FAFA9
FNLSHDQTLQFKFDALRIKLRNELRMFTPETWYSFSVLRRLRIHVFECPHRLSDKLLKSSATRLSAHRCEVAYITLSSFRVNPQFQDFLLFNQPGSSCEVIHIRRVDGGAL